VEAVKKSAAERELLDSAEIKRLQTTLSDRELAEHREQQQASARLQSIADRLGRLAYWSVLCILGLIALAAAVFAITGTAVVSRVGAGLIFLIVVVGSLLGLSSLAVGISLTGMARRVGEATAKLGNDWLTRHFGPKVDSSARDRDDTQDDREPDAT
jgi:hypothetical protein